LYQAFGSDLTPPERLWLANFERELQSSSENYQRLAGKNDQELLAVIDEQIGRIRSRTPASPIQPKLALVCEKSDLENVRRLEADIRTRGLMDVCSPDFLGGRMRAMEIVRRWQEYLSCSEALLFYDGVTERERLELIWEAAQPHKQNSRRDWFLAPPDLDTKRQVHPDALWTIDQVIRFMEGRRTQQA